MLDPKQLRENGAEIAQRLAECGYQLDLTQLEALDSECRALQTQTQTLQSQRNAQSKAIGMAKAKGEDVASAMVVVEAINQELEQSQAQLQTVEKQRHQLLLDIPNVPHPSVPIGQSEDDNECVRTWGEPTQFDFKPKDHVDLGAQLSGIDFEMAGKLTGSRFVCLYGPLAKLHRALIQFMLDLHTKQHGYQEVYIPYIVNQDSLLGTSQLPKFAEDLFQVSQDPALWLIPTAEVPVTNMARDVIFEASDLPKKFVCHSPSFRSEAGSYGKDTRGMLRQHQFEKIELVHYAKPEQSYETLEILTSHAEAVLQQLKLPYRVMNLCSGDIGFAASKTYDLEVWLPGQDAYREISSCSNTEDFQARRMRARWRNPNQKKPELIHTLNGSGLAVGRALIAVVENYQQADGSIKVPDVLQPYMGIDRVK